MDTAGTVMVLIGIYLLTSAIKNRQPIKTVQDIIKNPSAIRSTLNSQTGYADTRTVTNAGTGVVASADGGNVSTLNASTNASRAIAFARAQIGKPYIWGGNGPTGYDCSGLVKAAWKQGGYTTPRTTAAMIVDGKLTKVTKAELIPGDLVFPYPGHVMLYAGNGYVIEAPGRGRKVLERKMTSFWTARRVPINGGATV